MEEFDSSPMNSTPSSSMRTESITTDFTVFIDKLTPFLYEMKNSMETTELSSVHKAVDSLESDYTKAKAAINTQNIQSSPSKNIEYLIQNLGRSLGLVLFTSHDVSVSNRERIEALCKEMMNVKFDQCSDQQSEFETEEETEITGEQETEITMEGSFGNSSIDDTIMQIRYGDEEEELKNALFGLNAYIIDGEVSNEKIIDEDLIRILFSRLVSCEGNQRAIIIQVLRNLSIQNHQHKEMMKDLQHLSSIVTSLTRDVDERREAVRLLLNLCDDTGVRKKMGKIQGCIVMLVDICNGDDLEASSNAKQVLNAMSSNTHHALHMAEAGYFQPLIKYLKEGSDMSKVVMATALSRMDISDQNKTFLGEQGTIEPLVKMFNTGNFEAKLSSLNALQNLSNSKPNIKKLIRSGIVTTLLQLLFSVTSVLMALREPASAILAKVAKSESILIKQDIAQQMLSLLTLTSPLIQNHLLEALNNITSHSSAGKVRKKMLENGAIQLLFPFFKETDTQIRTSALQLVYTLSKDIIEGELVETIGYTHLSSILNIALSSTSELEIAASLGIISNFPIHDRKLTDLLKNANLLRLLVSLKSENSSCLAEGISGILFRFTVPNDKKLQRYSVEKGIVLILLNLLSSSSGIAKGRAALCLAQLSENSLGLGKSRKSKRFCLTRSGEKCCEVHKSVKSTFCLVKSGAVRQLVQVLEGNERGADEKILSCLSTLLDDEICESGCNYIVKESGVDAIMKVLEFGNMKAQEKAVWILEKIFGVEAHRVRYYESCNGLLVTVKENCDPLLKPKVDKLLALLGCVQVDSA